jgi:ABC-2 type transport system ATP-binding protein
VIVTHLSKRYGQTPAVREVGFDVRPGEIFGLLGPNGAGKTTTIECILGLRQPDGGSITLCEVDAIAEPAKVRQFIGAQLQATSLQPKITPLEALTLFAAFYERPAKPEELIERFNLREKQNARFDTLSGGQKQRLALALSLINNPKIVFLDEPTAGLDPHARRDLHSAIRALRDQQRAILLSTHYIEEAEELCDRVAILHEGRIVAIATPSELIRGSTSGALISFQLSAPIGIDRIASLRGAVNPQINGSQGSVRSENPTQTIQDLLKLAEASNLSLVDLRLRQATLEDVFLELTGRSLNEKSEP